MTAGTIHLQLQVMRKVRIACGFSVLINILPDLPFSVIRRRTSLQQAGIMAGAAAYLGMFSPVDGTSRLRHSRGNRMTIRPAAKR